MRRQRWACHRRNPVLVSVATALVFLGTDALARPTLPPAILALLGFTAGICVVWLGAAFLEEFRSQ